MSLTWSTACPDWEQRLMSGGSLVPDLPLFKAEAARALRIFKRLRIPDMIGMPTMRDVAGPWLFPIVEAIFGAYDPSTDRRMIQELFWLIPKKNTKSSSAAAIMVEALILNRRPEGEFVLVAPTKEIADISFKQASGTIRADDELDKLFQIQKHIRRITHRRTGAALQVKAADTDVITGGKQVGTLIDELHVLAGRSDAADIMVEIRGALTARPDGFLITITTQSKRPPSGIFRAELNKARDVRDGKIQFPLLPILYELPPKLAVDGGWKERKHWGYVNPNLNRSVNEEFLVRELQSAEREGDAQLALFASQHFNVEIGVGLRTNGWPGAPFWEKAGRELSLDDLIAQCDCATVGVDGGGLDDFYAVYVMGRQRETRRWIGWGHAWLHRKVLELRKSEAARFLDFERDGDLTIIDSFGPDITGTVDIIRQLDDAGILATIGMDPMGVGAVVDAIEEAGLGGDDRVVGVSQGYKLQGAVKTVERKVSDGTFVHCSQPLLAYAVGNAKTELRGNAVIVTKQASGTGKIDPLMALFDAAALMSMNPEPRTKQSAYNDGRSLIVL